MSVMPYRDPEERRTKQAAAKRKKRRLLVDEQAEAARMRRGIPGHSAIGDDGAIDGRFGRWLAEVLTSARIPTRRLVAALQSHSDADADSRLRDLRRIRGGQTKRPLPKKVFAIGEALHDCGIAWCSGLIALFEARYLVEMCEFAGHLAVTDGERAACLLTGFAGFNVTWESSDYEPSNDLKAHSRALLAKAYDGASNQKAWATRGSALATSQSSIADLRSARIAASATDLTDEERVTRVLACLSAWAETVDVPTSPELLRLRFFVAERWRASLAVVRLGLDGARTAATCQQAAFAPNRGESDNELDACCSGDFATKDGDDFTSAFAEELDAAIGDKVARDEAVKAVAERLAVSIARRHLARAAEASVDVFTPEAVESARVTFINDLGRVAEDQRLLQLRVTNICLAGARDAKIVQPIVTHWLWQLQILLTSHVDSQADCAG